MNGKRLSILIYHRVLDVADPLRVGEVDVRRFDAQMSWVKRCFNVLDLGEALERLKSGTLPPRALSITFDDGYRDNYTNALPILKRHGLTATFFIATAFLNGGIMWNDVVIEGVRNTNHQKIDLTEHGLGVYEFSTDRIVVMNKLLADLKYTTYEDRRNIVGLLPQLFGIEMPCDLMMDDSEVKALAANGMAIGGHTENHPILSKLTSQDARREIEGGKRYLENLLGFELSLFAYPNGRPVQDYAREHINIVQELGFKGAVSTAHGVAGVHSDIYQLPRFTPWDYSVAKYLLRLGRMRYSGPEVKV